MSNIKKFNQFLTEVTKYTFDEFKALGKNTDKGKCFFVYESNYPVVKEMDLISDYSLHNKDVFVPFQRNEELSGGGKIYYCTNFDLTNYEKATPKTFNIVMEKYIKSLSQPVFYRNKRVVNVDFYNYDLDQKSEEVLISKVDKMVNLCIELDMDRDETSRDFYIIAHKKNLSDIKLLHKNFNKYLK